MRMLNFASHKAIMKQAIADWTAAPFHCHWALCSPFTSL